MTPAVWATNEDIAQKRKAYNKLLMTTHWSSRGVNLFPDRIGKVPTISELPDIAKTKLSKPNLFGENDRP
jgi:hypothetical protein